MDNKEMQLESISRMIEEHEMTKAPPIFELYASIVAMSIATILFLIPGILEQDSGIYKLMTAILPQSGWAGLFLLAGLTGAIGMLMNFRPARIGGLIFEAVLYGTITVIYLMNLPNFGSVLMFWLTVFTVASIPLVKYTGLKH